MRGYSGGKYPDVDTAINTLDHTDSVAYRNSVNKMKGDTQIICRVTDVTGGDLFNGVLAGKDDIGSESPASGRSFESLIFITSNHYSKKRAIGSEF